MLNFQLVTKTAYNNTRMTYGCDVGIKRAKSNYFKCENVSVNCIRSLTLIYPDLIFDKQITDNVSYPGGNRVYTGIRIGEHTILCM